MPHTKTMSVPHLGGIEAGYQMPRPYDASKPTVVLVNSLCSSAALYASQFNDARLTEAMNLIAIEPLGHGQTRTKRPSYTFWDTAIMNLQVLEALGIEKAFALGTSQGGFIVTRMALLDPDKIQGILPLGTSLDRECERTRTLGCWDGVLVTTDLAQRIWASRAPDFTVDQEFIDIFLETGFGSTCTEEQRRFWTQALQQDFRGVDGAARASMNLINVAERDGLMRRLPFVTCPVLWLHGTDDVVFSVANAEDEIKSFTASPSASLQTVQGGQHFLSASNPKEVNEALLGFVRRYHCSPAKETSR